MFLQAEIEREKADRLQHGRDVVARAQQILERNAGLVTPAMAAVAERMAELETARRPGAVRLQPSPEPPPEPAGNGSLFEAPQLPGASYSQRRVSFDTTKGKSLIEATFDVRDWPDGFAAALEGFLQEQRGMMHPPPRLILV